MNDKKGLAGKEQGSVSATVRRRKRSTKTAATEDTQRSEMAGAGQVKSPAATPPISAKRADPSADQASGDAGFLSAEDLKHFREIFKNKVSPKQEIVEAEEAVPGLSPAEDLDAKADSGKRKRRGRGPQKSPTKVLTSIRLDQEVYEYFRDSGRGWQSRINDFLTEKMQRERRSKRRKANAADESVTSNKSA